MKKSRAHPLLPALTLFYCVGCSARVVSARVTDVPEVVDASAADVTGADAPRAETSDLGRLPASPAACLSDRDCADSDPCTVDERCDPSARVCRASTLDGDRDGHTPRACGGDDCDDGRGDVNTATPERCNGVDDNCDGVVDGEAARATCEAGGSCVDGACVSDAACGMEPTAVASDVVLRDLRGVSDFAFDGRGGAAAAIGTDVVLIGRTGAIPVTMVMGGTVVALRYTHTHGLMLGVVSRADGGVSGGAIYQLLPDATTPRLRHGSLRSLGGLAIGRDDSVWFSDTAANTVYRMSAEADGSTPALPVLTTITTPTLLLPDAAERYLLVAQSALNKIVRVDLRPGGGGRVGSMEDFVVELDRVTGLAMDECQNVYIADGPLNRVYRAPLALDRSVTRLFGTAAPTGLAFGAGSPYSPRLLYTLSGTDGTLRAANVIVRGIPFAVPR